MSHPKPRVLVVDDQPDICENLADILTDLGYGVDTAHDGPSALELVRQRPYDVALLDLRMPGMDGLTLHREIRKLRTGTVAMIVTAYASEATASDAIELGAWRVVPKPVDVAALLGLIEQAVGQPLVLVVDDDRELCANLGDLLQRREYRVYLAHDAAEAAQRLREASYRVILIDVKLPEADGRSVLEMVQRCDPKARTVLITGHRPELEPQVDQALREGVDAVCFKPFDVPRLLALLDRLSAHRCDDTAPR
jgi:DNA-binding NtrC family response regulator